MNFSWLRKLFPKRPPYEQAFADAKTPDAVCKIVARWIREDPEAEDEWTSPPETWARGYGDCEDFSFLIAEQCNRLGFPCGVHFFYVIGVHQEGHALAIGQGWVADMAEYIPKATFQDAREIAARKLDTTPDRLWFAIVPPPKHKK